METPTNVALNPREKLAMPLVEKEILSESVRRFRFGLPSKDHVLGLPVGKHFFVSGRWNGEFVMRPYTPVSGDELPGYVDLVIKVYFPNERFPEGGKLSQLLDTLKIGDSLDIQGPVGHIEYKEPGLFLVKKKPRPVTHLAMLAGGTGITPMYQVLEAILKNPDDKTECSLIYANQTEDDILLRDEVRPGRGSSQLRQGRLSRGSREAFSMSLTPCPNVSACSSRSANCPSWKSQSYQMQFAAAFG